MSLLIHLLWPCWIKVFIYFWKIVLIPNFWMEVNGTCCRDHVKLGKFHIIHKTERDCLHRKITHFSRRTDKGCLTKLWICFFTSDNRCVIYFVWKQYNTVCFVDFLSTVYLGVNCSADKTKMYYSAYIIVCFICNLFSGPAHISAFKSSVIAL